MSALNGLKFVSAKRPQNVAPIVQRRNKLSNQLWEQMELARALSEGKAYAPTRLRNVKDKLTGERKTVEAFKRVKQWWFATDNGKMAINIRYGARMLELAKGKFAIEVASDKELVPTLEALKTIAMSGELDAAIETASIKLREGFGK